MPRPKFLISLLFVLVFFLIFLVFFVRLNYVVPIVMYHSITPLGKYENRLTVTRETFERQMRFLKTHKYNVVPLEDLIPLLKEKKIPSKTIAITIDDGYKDNYAYAFPILKKYNIPATIFIIVNEVGREQNDRLSWDEIKEMAESGIIAIGSHCLGPEPLINLKSDEALKEEIFASKRILEEKLGKEIDTFAYPGGMFNGKIRQLVIDAGYKLAVSTNPGKEYSRDDVFALKRLRISENAKNLFVFWFETTGFYTFMKEHRHK